MQLRQSLDATSTVKVISFDLWLTLIRSNRIPNRASRAQALYDCFAPDITLNAFKEVVQQAEKRADDLSETGTQHYGPYERTMLVAHAVSRPMMDGPTFAAFYAAQTARFLEYPPELMQPDILDVLQQLRQRYEQLVLVSNTGFVNGAEMRQVLKLIGLLDYFDLLLFSDEVGVNKPNPGIFTQLLTGTTVAPTSVLHIGDNLRADYHGAMAMGFQAIHLTPGSTLRSTVQHLI